MEPWVVDVSIRRARWVTDCTYFQAWTGMVYVAARLRRGWILRSAARLADPRRRRRSVKRRRTTPSLSLFRGLRLEAVTQSVNGFHWGSGYRCRPSRPR